MKILSNFMCWYSGNDEPEFEILNFGQLLSYLLTVNVSFLYLLPSLVKMDVTYGYFSQLKNIPYCRQ